MFIEELPQAYRYCPVSDRAIDLVVARLVTVEQLGVGLLTYSDVFIEVDGGVTVLYDLWSRQPVARWDSDIITLKVMA